MHKIANAKLLPPVQIPIALLDRLDRCVSLLNESNPLQSTSRATLVRIAIQRYVDAIEPDLVRGRISAPLGLPSGADPTGKLSGPKAKPATRSRVRRSPTGKGGKR